MKTDKKSIRVGVVVASLDILGGQAVAACRLLDGLRQSKRIHAELIPINPRLPKWLRWMQRIKYLRTLVTFTYYLFSLLIRIPKFDVLHVFSASNFSFLLAPAPAVMVGRLFGKPVILNYHSGEAERHLKNWAKTAMPIFKLAHKIIVPSAYLVGVLAKFGIASEAIPNTVDLGQFRFHQHRPLRPIIFTNRNFETHYNVGCALRAFALVQQQIPEMQLIIAGDGSQRKQLHELAQKLQLKNLEFVGAVSPQEMAELYHRADIYLNASVVDNMPLSILEAFACGLAVVTTNAGGIPLMVKNRQNGLLVASGDERALAEAILAVYRNPRLADRLIKQALKDCQAFTWNTVGERWIALYEQLACEHSPTSTVTRQPAENEPAIVAQTGGSD
ncbi:MAG: glycosyltransferase family 4 protein [Acidobacteriota bacterium]